MNIRKEMFGISGIQSKIDTLDPTNASVIPAAVEWRAEIQKLAYPLDSRFSTLHSNAIAEDGRGNGIGLSELPRSYFFSMRSLFYVTIFFLFFGVTSDNAFCDNAGNRETDCDIQNASCTKSLSDLLVTLDIHPKPVKAMTDLVFAISIEGDIKGDTPYIDLGMPGMEMGPNRVFLKETAQGEFEGNGIIVRCKSGRRIWRATITIPGNGTVEYLFDVIY